MSFFGLTTGARPFPGLERDKVFCQHRCSPALLFSSSVPDGSNLLIARRPTSSPLPQQNYVGRIRPATHHLLLGPNPQDRG